MHSSKVHKKSGSENVTLQEQDLFSLNRRPGYAIRSNTWDQLAFSAGIRTTDRAVDRTNKI